MKISKQQLKKIIKEEKAKLLLEMSGGFESETLQQPEYVLIAFRPEDFYQNPHLAGKKVGEYRRVVEEEMDNMGLSDYRIVNYPEKGRGRKKGVGTYVMEAPFEILWMGWQSFLKLYNLDIGELADSFDMVVMDGNVPDFDEDY